jgi:hypothetical protein
MTFIEGATESIFDHYGPEAQIHSVEHGGQHAHVSLRTGENKGVDTFIVEKGGKPGFCKGGVSGLIYTMAGGIRRDSAGTISSCAPGRRERVAHSHLLKYRCHRPGLSCACRGVINRVNTVR